ncbi:MAG: hypothetical protein P8X74_01495 [Reinekea sp.]
MANSSVPDISNMSLDDVKGMQIPDSPEAALGILQEMYKKAQKLTLQREVMSLLQKLIQDTIKKIGQAA